MVSGEDDDEAGTPSYVPPAGHGQPHRFAGVAGKVDLKQPRMSKFVHDLNAKVLKPTRMYPSALDQLDIEIKNLPSPSSLAQIEHCIVTLEEAQPGRRFDPVVRKVLLELGYQRKLPITGGRRGAKAAPIPAHGLWYQALGHTDAMYEEMERYLPVLFHVLGTTAAAAGSRSTRWRRMSRRARGSSAPPVRCPR